MRPQSLCAPARSTNCIARVQQRNEGKPKQREGESADCDDSAWMRVQLCAQRGRALHETSSASIALINDATIIVRIIA